MDHSESSLDHSPPSEHEGKSSSSRSERAISLHIIEHVEEGLLPSSSPSEEENCSEHARSESRSRSRSGAAAELSVIWEPPPPPTQPASAADLVIRAEFALEIESRHEESEIAGAFSADVPFLARCPLGTPPRTSEISEKEASGAEFAVDSSLLCLFTSFSQQCGIIPIPRLPSPLLSLDRSVA